MRILGVIFWWFTVLGYTLGNHRNTVDGCEILHHQKDVWKPYKYGINQLSTGAGLYHLQQIWMSISKTYWKIPQKLLVFIQKGFPAHSWWSLIYKRYYTVTLWRRNPESDVENGGPKPISLLGCYWMEF
jgi:hypothetical protein